MEEIVDIILYTLLIGGITCVWAFVCYLVYLVSKYPSTTPTIIERIIKEDKL